MKNKILILLFIGSWIFTSCKTRQAGNEATVISKALVKTTTVRKGSIHDYLILTGKTIYLNKSNIMAPVTGYVTKVNVKPGSSVDKDDILFEIMTQETYTLKNKGSFIKDYQSTAVLSPVTGIVNRLDIVKSPVFVDKNSTLCSIVDINDLQVETEVPFEYERLATPGKSCLIQLPDNSEYQAVFYKVLPEMNLKSQTMRVLARIQPRSLIPEKMIVQVLIDKSGKTERQILPKSCILSDVLMKEFWVMKIINDSTAVKIPVKLGRQNHNEAEIIEPAFNEGDNIISEGGYGLADTSLVEIVR